MFLISENVSLVIVPNFCENLGSCSYGIFLIKCDALRDLVPFVQFIKGEKHPWRSVNFSKVAD